VTETPRPSDVVLVAAGGCAGSLARAAVALLVPHPSGTWPWSTVLVNVVGSFALALLLAGVAAPTAKSRRIRLLVGTGLLGGFTTFSAFALDIGQLVDAERPGTALAYLLTSVGSVLLGAAAGLVLGRRADQGTGACR